jgi:hypothetical protein
MLVAQVSIARLAPGAAYTPVLCVLGAAGLALLAVNRVAYQPPFLWAFGMESCLSFGSVMMSTQHMPNLLAVWTSVSAAAAACCLLCLPDACKGLLPSWMHAVMVP